MFQHENFEFHSNQISYVSTLSSNKTLIFMLLCCIFHSNHRPVLQDKTFHVSRLLIFFLFPKCGSKILLSWIIPCPGFYSFPVWTQGTLSEDSESLHSSLHKSSLKYSLVVTCSVPLPASLKPKTRCWLIAFSRGAVMKMSTVHWRKWLYTEKQQARDPL